MPTKTCKICGVEKSLDEFHNDQTKPDGKVNKCKSCVRTCSTEYNQRETVKQKQKARYQENRDRILAIQKERRANNIDHFHAMERAGRQRHRAKRNAYEKERRRRKREALGLPARRSLPYDQNELFDQGQRYCTKCQTIQSVAEFWANKNKRNGLEYECKNCTRLRRRVGVKPPKPPKPPKQVKPPREPKPPKPPKPKREHKVDGKKAAAASLADILRQIREAKEAQERGWK